VLVSFFFGSKTPKIIKMSTRPPFKKTTKRRCPKQIYSDTCVFLLLQYPWTGKKKSNRFFDTAYSGRLKLGAGRVEGTNTQKCSKNSIL